MKCFNCDERIDKDSKFCEFCGANITENKVEIDNPQSEGYKEVYSKNYFKRLFEGRINRKNLLFGILASFALTILIMIITFIFFQTDTGELTDGGSLVVFLTYALWSIYGYSLYVKRLHDLGKSGYQALLLFVPLLNFIFVLYLFFAQGEIGENKFGKRPSNRSLSLKELFSLK